MKLDKRAIGWALMLAGIVAWLTGELIGVRSNRTMDTTSEWVWWLQSRPWVGPVLRVMVGVFCLSLAGHFWYGWALLP